MSHIQCLWYNDINQNHVDKTITFGWFFKITEFYNFAFVFFWNSKLCCKTTGYTFMIHSIVHRWPLLSLIFQIAYESRVEKTDHLLRLSNRSNFLLLHKTESASAGQAVCHWSKQVIVRGSNVWRIRRVG